MPKQPLSNDQYLIRKSILEPLQKEDARFQDLSSFFEFFAASQLAKDYDLDEDEIHSGLLGSGGDGGCDAMYVFYNNRLIRQDDIPNISYSRSGTIEALIVQAKLERSFREDTIEKWKTVSRNLLNLAFNADDYTQRYSKALLDQFAVLSAVYQGSARYPTRLKLRYVYATIANEKDLHPNVSRQGEELCQEIKEILPSAEMTIEFLGARGLLQLYQKAKETTFVLNVRCSAAAQPDAFVLLAKLKDYYMFISDKEGRLNNSLFESNVRDYQGHNMVNTSIGQTLSSPGAEDFWWLKQWCHDSCKKRDSLDINIFPVAGTKDCQWIADYDGNLQVLFQFWKED